MMNHYHPELENARYVAFVDDSRKYVDCSEGVCELLGYSRRELLRRRIDDISYDVAVVGPLFSKFLRQGALEGEFILQSKAKSPVFIRYKAFVFEDGCKAAIWEPVRDWREAYLTALNETNSAKLRPKLDAARTAIQAARLKASGDDEERTLDLAIDTLNTLFKNR